MLKDSGIEQTATKYIQNSFHSKVDIKPKFTMLFEPGPAHKFHEESGSEETDVLDDFQAFDQISKRKFVVRRGRNNRILMRSIMQNVFDEKGEKEVHPHQSQGYQHYVDKF